MKIQFLIFVILTTFRVIANTQTAYITNAYDYTVSVINVATNTVIDTIDLSVPPQGVAVSPDGNKVYITGTYWLSSSVSVVNTATNTVSTIIPSGGSGSFGISVNNNGSKLYVANSSDVTVTVINTTIDSVIATIYVGNNPYGIAVSPDGTKVYVAIKNVTGRVSVINTSTNTVSDTIPVGSYPWGLSVNPDGSKVYVANGNSNSISVINTATNMVTATISVGSGPEAICVSPNGNRIYVTNYLASTVSIIDAAIDTVLATIAVESHPTGISVSPDGNKVYVSCFGANTIDVINTAINQVTDTISVGDGPYSFGNFISTHISGIALPSLVSRNISVYPNPANNNITFENTHKGILEFINLQGQQIKTIKVASNKINIDVSDLLPGMYVLKMITENGIMTKKFIKQ